MDITVRKPNETEKAEMSKESVWECGVSEFDWHYDSEETCLIIEGEVTVNYVSSGKKSVSFSAGDYVIFPKGLSCVWKVTKPVKKYYIFK
ncbi:MAG: cupin domain-containing protein [Treponema sp.]|nr:cupin domain-containing protein [Treponema sp.]MCL2251733.1 cupin domain-containing protein [Treponema sp.]